MLNKFFASLLLCYSTITLSVLAEDLTEESLTIGEQICSSVECYTLVKELGEGVFGKVFVVEDPQGNQFALKCYKPYEFDGGPWWDLLSDVEREFVRGQVLSHPNIIRSIDHFKGESGVHFLVLEFVEGQTVSSIYRKSITIDQALDYARQLVDALQYADERGYLFLDLHQGNIMVSNAGQLKMIDLASFFSWDEILGVATPAESTGSKKEKGMKVLANKNLKMQKFLKENPKIEQLMKRKAKAIGQSSEGLQAELRALYYSIYFERLADICMDLIKRSDLDREEKIERVLEIQRVALNFSEDSLDSAMPPNFEIYLDTLKGKLL